MRSLCMEPGAAALPIGDNMARPPCAVYKWVLVPPAHPVLSTAPCRGQCQLLPRTTVTDTTRPALPDHLSIDPRSPHHVAAVFEHDVGIRFNGKERFDVEEYCVSEGWIKVPAGKTVDRKGRPLLLTLKGAVEAFYK